MVDQPGDAQEEEAGRAICCRGIKVEVVSGLRFYVALRRNFQPEIQDKSRENGRETFN